MPGESRKKCVPEMNRNQAKIVFMGTPDFAVPTLEAIHAAGFAVPLVVTRPDKRKGRGRKLSPPPVKSAAMALGLETDQPNTLRTDRFINKIASIGPDFIVVVAMGHILTPELMSRARFGAVNLHGSLLPKYRGPAPIQWAIMNREVQTGVTTMQMDAGVDTGDILLQRSTPIMPDDTAASVHDRLATIGAELMVDTLDALLAGTLTPRAQDHSQASYAPALSKQDGQIDWRKPAVAIEAFIRAMTPWPGAWFVCDQKRYRIFKARVIPMQCQATPGTIIQGFGSELRIATGEGALSILEIQEASGKRLAIRDFLCGCRLEPGLQAESSDTCPLP